MGVKIEVKGVEEFIQSISDVPKEHIQKTVRKYGAELQKQSQKNAPVDTGFLKQHIQPPELLDGGMTAKVVSSAEYSVYLEYGTRRMSARPYMRPALDSIKERFSKELIEWR